MAILKLGVVVTGIRGTIGGLTFTNTLGGATAKKWSKPRRTNTQKQSSVKALISGWPSAWRALSESDKEAWNTWAALPAQAKTNSLGENYYVSGFNWFTTVNTWRGMMTLDNLSIPPSGAWPAIPTITGVDYSVLLSVTTLDLTWDLGEFGLGEAVTVFANQLNGSGRTTLQSGYVHVKTVYEPGATGESFGPELQAIFGAPHVGDQVFLRVYKNSSEGLRSAAWSEYVLCA